MDTLSLSGSGSDLIIVPSQLRTEDQEFFSSSRETWKSRRDCIEAYFCALMSFSNGLQFGANIGKYGMLIFIPYIFWTIFVGVPVVLVVVIISRFVMSDTARAWDMCPVSKGILWILFATTVLSIINKFMYLVYLTKYFLASFSIPFKWATCDAYWNTISCYVPGMKTIAFNNCLKNRSESFCMTLNWETSGTQYWKYYIGNNTESLSYITTVICLLVAVVLVAVIIFRDIRSLQKSFLVMVLVPIILGVILTWVSFGTQEALMGFKQLFMFNWKWLFHPVIWIEGLESTLFFLGLGDLSLSFISSHGSFADDIFKDVIIITATGFCFSILFMFPIISISAGFHSRPTFDESAQLRLFGDKQDVFIAISDALTLYPFPNFIWAIMSYINYILIQVGAQSISIMAVCDVFVGMQKFNYSSVLIISLVSTFFMSLCFVFLKLEFFIDLGPVALVLTVLFTITWQLCYGMQKFNYDFFFMMKKAPPIFLKFSWVTSLLFTLMALFCKIYFGIPKKPYKYLCYIYVGIPIFIYLIMIIFEMGKASFNAKKCSHVFYPNPNWGPENSWVNRSRFIIASSNINKEFIYRQELNQKPYTKRDGFADQNIVQLI